MPGVWAALSGADPSSCEGGSTGSGGLRGVLAHSWCQSPQSQLAGQAGPSRGTPRRGLGSRPSRAPGVCERLQGRLALPLPSSCPWVCSSPLLRATPLRSPREVE